MSVCYFLVFNRFPCVKRFFSTLPDRRYRHHHRHHCCHITDTRYAAECTSGASTTGGQQFWPMASADVRSVKGNGPVVDRL